MNPVDEKNCEDMANHWLYLGGDAAGFNYLMSRILEILREIEGPDGQKQS